MRLFCCCLVLALQAAAPRAQGAQDVWRGLRWDMDRDRASQTLSRQGLKVRVQGRPKTSAPWLSVEAKRWHATVYFSHEGRMNHIVVYPGRLTKEAAAAAKERLTRRFGAVKDVSSRGERTWGTRIGATGPWTELLVVHIPDEGWHAREDYGCSEAGAPVGAFDLTWGQAAPDVEQRLRAAGFEARTTGMLIDPCRMPNPPSMCEPDASVNVVFTKGGDEGVADVDKKRGLVQLTFTARVASYADGLARAKPIEAFHGPAEIKDATIMTWGDATADVSLDLREEKNGRLSAIESYSPPGTLTRRVETAQTTDN